MVKIVDILGFSTSQISIYLPTIPDTTEPRCTPALQGHNRGATRTFYIRENQSTACLWKHLINLSSTIAHHRQSQSNSASRTIGYEVGNAKADQETIGQMFNLLGEPENKTDNCNILWDKAGIDTELSSIL